MSEISFIEEDNRREKSRKSVVVKSKFAAFFIRKGLVKTERQANVVMVILTIVMVSVIIYQNL